MAFSNILFQKCDVSKWADVVSFFQSTYDKFGPIDAAISNAAINIVEPFDDLKDATKAKTSELKEPDLSVLNVNMVGTWYVTKCAVHFFDKHPETASQLVLFGSVASFFDTPPLYTYCASKAAVVGLMRALRTQLPKRNATVNVIAPWMTSEQKPYVLFLLFLISHRPAANCLCSSHGHGNRPHQRSMGRLAGE